MDLEILACAKWFWLDKWITLISMQITMFQYIFFHNPLQEIPVEGE
jgi:hypothetical protein